jgi:hypothetical protein
LVEFTGAGLQHPVQYAVRDCFHSPRIETVAIVPDVAMLIIVMSRRRRSNVLQNKTAGRILCRQTWVGSVAGLGLAALPAPHTSCRART